MLCFPFILKWTRCYHGSNSKIWSKYSVIKLQQRMDSQVPASTQISQLLWIVGNISAYAQTNWQIFSTFETWRHKFRHKFKSQLERTLVLCISLFKPITSLKDGCLHSLIKARWSFQAREAGQKALSNSRGGVVSGFKAKVPCHPLAFLSHPSLISQILPQLRSWTYFHDHFSSQILFLHKLFFPEPDPPQLPELLCRNTMCAQAPLWQFFGMSLEDLGHVIFV